MFAFLGCTLAGMQVPAFVDQYAKSLESHLAESRMALNAFQDDADRYFGGSLEKLIGHYIGNEDQVFNEGGRSIQSIYDRYRVLQTSFTQFQSNPWSAYSQALFAPVPDVRAEVWKNYTYAIQLTPGAIAFGLLVGLFFSLGIELVVRFLLKATGLVRRQSQAMPRRS